MQLADESLRQRSVLQRRLLLHHQQPDIARFHLLKIFHLSLANYFTKKQQQFRLAIGQRVPFNVVTIVVELHGEYAGEFRGRKWYAVPTPEKLASLTVEDLAPVRLGYRDKYLIETARRWLEMSPEERLNVGCFTGVGPKVESCIKLFGMHDLESFPIDVWVKRLMNRFYGFDEKDKAGMDDFAKEHFGEYAGLAQQYLFYYIRCLDMNKEKK